MDQLTAVNESKLRLLEELSMYEDVRVDLMRQLEAIWKVPSDTLTIGHIVGGVGGSMAERLKISADATQSVPFLPPDIAIKLRAPCLHKSLAFLHEAVSIVRAPFHVQLSLYSRIGIDARSDDRRRTSRAEGNRQCREYRTFSTSARPVFFAFQESLSVTAHNIRQSEYERLFETGCDFIGDPAVEWSPRSNRDRRRSQDHQA